MNKILNPYKNLSKINPQREKGNRQIANDVFIALIKAKLSGGEYQVILFIIHKSWGFNKNSDSISYSQIMKNSRLSRPAVINIIKKLEQKRILIIERQKVINKLPFNEYLFNKHYDTWLNITGKAMFTSSDVEQISNTVKLVKPGLLVQEQTSKLSKQKLVKPGLPTKESITKENIHTVFSFWKEILNHPKAILSPDRIAKIKDRLKEGHTIEQCKQAILGCKSSPYHMGDNHNGKNGAGITYDSIDLIFKKGDKLEQFIGYYEQTQKDKLEEVVA